MKCVIRAWPMALISALLFTVIPGLAVFGDQWLERTPQVFPSGNHRHYVKRIPTDERAEALGNTDGAVAKVFRAGAGVCDKELWETRISSFGSVYLGWRARRIVVVSSIKVSPFAVAIYGPDGFIAGYDYDDLVQRMDLVGETAGTYLWRPPQGPERFIHSKDFQIATVEGDTILIDTTDGTTVER